jgi:hypothetical protein
MICDRCYRPLDQGAHGLYQCPLEPRRAHTVRPDDIPGGLLVEGLPNPDGTPGRFYSHSAIRQEAAARGFVPWGEQWESSRTRDGQVYLDWMRSGEYAQRKRERAEQRRETRR